MRNLDFRNDDFNSLNVLSVSSLSVMMMMTPAFSLLTSIHHWQLFVSLSDEFLFLQQATQPFLSATIWYTMNN
ncbi:CLUMA_CG007418, isoform A [Clunio marinus]|uniref:CLUMA_CG007418, isoform A n=1 Tax=Clunio marinus TaxID=568069 RepID=A0A1J1I110_9DIPT|nr:CLUMA_CG007418, isoform A [Clunio marinus]